MTSAPPIPLGFEVGTAAPVAIPRMHLCICGQTQQAGKTTALEGLITRSGLRALTFITKRGESSFAGGRRIGPYFRERADWQFVASILEASRHEKLKFERAWIIRASRGARTLADVHANVRRALHTAKGLSGDVYLTLDAYLADVVPQIGRVKWASSLELTAGVNVVDLAALSVEMQHLVIRSALEWILEREHDTVVVIPEAWAFIPQGRGTPVKLAAEAYVRQGAALGNLLWLDSQDIGGIDKTILRSVGTWILGVQREANEIKRTLSNIPASVKKPSAAALATLELGQFFACWGNHTIRTFARPAWMAEELARQVATGAIDVRNAAAIAGVGVLKRALDTPDTADTAHAPHEDPTVTKAEADRLVAELEQLRAENANLRHRLEELEAPLHREASPFVPPRTSTSGTGKTYTFEESRDAEAMYQAIKARLVKEVPALLRVLVDEPALEVEITRQVITVEGSALKGRIARLILDGFFDGEGKTQGATRTELKRTGPDVNQGNLWRTVSELVRDGFLTAEAGNLYRAVPAMKRNIRERGAA